MKKVVFILVLAFILMAVLSSIALAAAPEAPLDVGDMVTVDDAAAVQPVADVGDPDPGGFNIFALMITLAILIESLAELVKAAIAPKILPKWVWFLITSIIGIALCILFKIDMLAALGFVGGAAAVWISEILTGIAVGAGSGFIHTLLGKWTASKNADKVLASVQPGELIEFTGTAETTNENKE